MSELSTKEILEKIEVRSRERERIEKAIAVLRQQAWDQNIYDKAVAVARVLGLDVGDQIHQIYDRGRLYIDHQYVSYAEKVTIKYKDSIVYLYQYGKSWAYRPDVPEWESLLGSAYAEAERSMELNAKEESQMIVLKLAENWGIKVADYEAVPWGAVPPMKDKDLSEPEKPPQTAPMPLKYSYARR